MSMSPLHKGFYSDAGLQVRSYDALLTQSSISSSGDIEFYLDLVREARGRVLEVGVGTGRIAIALARKGIEVIGLDASKAMLDIARRKARLSRVNSSLKLIYGDMRSFEIHQNFRVILVPFFAFQHLLTSSDQRTCLETLRRHTEPGGLIAIHLFDPDLYALAQGGAPKICKRIAVDAKTGHVVEAIWEGATLDYVEQQRRDVWRYRRYDGSGGCVEEELAQLTIRWSFRWEMRHLFEVAGLKVLAEYSDFRRSPASYANDQIWILSPAGNP
jgi:ubiquinone/menaquinone biosynthesis C-methylase UbiE